jgi:UTP:GlnB (protein PII) uridylyltransferase
MSIHLSAPPEFSEAKLKVLPGPPRMLPWQERREWFRTRFEQTPPPGLSVEEVQAHFTTMPPYYWEQVDESDFIWGLESVHGFLKLMASPHASATAAYVSWRQNTEPDFTRLMLCTWDRHGLLAKAAAAFSAVRMNIVHAHIFTRTDNMVLDQFCVTASGGCGPVSDSRLREMTFLLDGALSEPPRFASVWACSRHKFLAVPSSVPPQIGYDNLTSPDSTLVHIEAADRLGLLYDILQAIADNGFNIKQAHIETRQQLACDTIHITDQDGQKILHDNALKSLCAKLHDVLTIRD